MGLVYNRPCIQWAWYILGLRYNDLVNNGPGTQRAWYTLGLRYNDFGKQCAWYTTDLVHNGPGTHWAWYVAMPLVNNGLINS